MRGTTGWIPAFNAIVVSAAQAVERAISTPYRAAYDPGWISYLEDKATAARDQLIADRPAAGRTYVGAFNPWTGDVAAGRSGVKGVPCGAGGRVCAEDTAANELGMPKNRAGFTKAIQLVQDRSGDRLPNGAWPLKPADKGVCSINCQLDTDRSQYPADVTYDAGGRWGPVT